MNRLKFDKSLQSYLQASQTKILRGDAEAREKLTEHADRAIARVHQTVDHLPEAEQKEARHLKTALDELKLQFALGKMEGAEKLKNLEERIEYGFVSLKKAVKKAEKIGEKETKEANHALHEGWEKLQLEMMILYVRLDLAHEAGSQKLGAAKDEFISDIKLIAEFGKEEADHLGEDFSAWIKRSQKSVGEKSHRFLERLKKRFEV